MMNGRHRKGRWVVLQSLKLLATPLCLLGLMGTVQIHAATFARPFPVPAAVFPAIPISPATAENAPARRRCQECGVIASMREIGSDDMGRPVDGAVAVPAAGRDAKDTHPVRALELTVRFRDGSQRVLVDASPARWRLGEQMSVIDGQN